MAVGGLFVEVGMMLVEGRVAGTIPGPPRPGPHCPQLPPAAQSTHLCNQSNHLCARAEALRRHMTLLSESRVPMCIDVYLCADCTCGRSRAAASQPASSDLLLEQWTIAFLKSGGQQGGGGGIEVDGKGLMAAIRSQLHFSQLSAWYSRLGGTAVPPVCYRLSHPAPAPPAPPFHRPPVEHVFPTVRVHSNDCLKVSMKALPRLDNIPHVLCPAHCLKPEKSTATTTIPPLVPPPQPVRTTPTKQRTHLYPKPSNSHPITLGESGGSTGPAPRPVVSMQASIASAAPTATQAAQATITAFRTVFAELGHCLLDPPSRIPPLKQGFLAWRERRSQVVSSQPQSRSAAQSTVHISSTSNKPSSIGMVDDRMQCGCKHIGKHHCEEPLDTEQEPTSDQQINYNSGCDNKERRKSTSSTPPPCLNDLNNTRTTNQTHTHCGNCRERELNRANAHHCGAPLDGSAPIRDTAPQIILTPATQCQPNPLKRKRQQEMSNSKKMLSDKTPDLNSLTSQQLVDIFRRLDIRSSDPPSKQDVGGKGVEVLSVVGSPSASVSPLTCSPLTDSPLLTPSPLATSPLLSSPSPNKKNGWSDSSSEDTESESPSRLDSRPSVAVHHRPMMRFPGPPPIPRFSGPLLGSLEESLLKRRLRPDRVVTEGYTVDLGASGSFCPKHLTLPVTVQFYPPVGLSTPLMGCLVVGKKGYSVPRSGTIQATLLNPHGTVVKMFVVPYHLEDMPANSTTFVRQRITTSATQSLSQPLLRYLIHLRFCSSKSGRIYLEGEISMVVCRQYDADATLGLDPLDSNSHLSSVIVSPDNPKYSSRK